MNKAITLDSQRLTRRVRKSAELYVGLLTSPASVNVLILTPLDVEAVISRIPKSQRQALCSPLRAHVRDRLQMVAVNRGVSGAISDWRGEELARCRLHRTESFHASCKESAVLLRAPDAWTSQTYPTCGALCVTGALGATYREMRCTNVDCSAVAYCTVCSVTRAKP